MKQKDRIDIHVRILVTLLAVMSAALLACIARGYSALIAADNAMVWGCAIGVGCCGLVITGLCLTLFKKANEVVHYD
tara:strand:- start:932 stop:1162 length:231 start_codon:yes stop_codon:yes gene_type:complete